LELDRPSDRVAPEWKWLLLLVIMGIIGTVITRVWILFLFALGLFLLAKNHSLRWKRMSDEKDKKPLGFNLFNFHAEVGGFDVHFGVEKTAEQKEREATARQKELDEKKAKEAEPKEVKK